MEVEENQEQNIIRLDTVNKVKENMLEEEINIRFSRTIQSICRLY